MTNNGSLKLKTTHIESNSKSSTIITRRFKWRKRKRNVKCWYKIEWDKLQFFFGTFSRIHTYWRTDKRSVILNCFWSSTSYAHTFSSEKMVLTYKDYKMACQTMANSKSSSWSFHLLDIIFISYSIQLQKRI